MQYDSSLMWNYLQILPLKSGNISEYKVAVLVKIVTEDAAILTNIQLKL